MADDHIPMYGTYCRLNVHSSDSPRAVIRAARRKLNDHGRTRAFRENRRVFYGYMLAHHARWQATVAWIR